MSLMQNKQRTRRLLWSIIALLVIGGAVAGGLFTLNQQRSRAATSITYSTPLTITQGGTYSGNWESTDANTPAVVIQTTAPVVIENCNVRGPGNLITTRLSDAQNNSNTNVTVRNCHGISYAPQESGRAPGYFFIAVYFQNVDLENNTLENTRGIWLVGQSQAGTQKSVKVLRNQAKNLNGATSDGATCSSKNTGGFTANGGACGASFVQLVGVQQVPGVEIAWNEVINEPGKSRVEDTINIYNSSGTPESPLLLHDNYIQGAYPTQPGTDTKYYGGGINVADGDGATAYVHAYNNQVVSSANGGIYIASGHDNQVYQNRVVRDGYLPDGTAIVSHFSGIWVWACCNDQIQKNPPGFYNNVAHDNVTGYVWVDSNGGHRNDIYVPNCATDANGASLCTNNVSLPDPITQDTEKAEYTLWQQKVSQNGVTVGASGGDSGGSGSGSSSSSFTFTNGMPQLSWSNTVDSDAYPAGNSSNISGVCCTLSRPETKVLSETGHTGTSSLVYSGNATSSDSTDFAYSKVFDLGQQSIMVGSNTILSYWIYPQSSQTFGGLSGNNSSCVALDLLFTDGTNLRDSGAVDQNGNRVHPASQCGHLTLDSWNQVVVNLGASANGKTINRIDVGYDQLAHTGSYRGYIDDIQIRK